MWIASIRSMLSNRWVKNDRGAAQSNTKRIAAIMQRAPQGATLFFPGGDYYFAGFGGAESRNDRVYGDRTGISRRGRGDDPYFPDRCAPGFRLCLPRGSEAGSRRDDPHPA